MSATDVANRFYAAFAAHDGATMAACYAPDATFADPVFPGLDARRAGAMWRMLCERGGANLVVTHRIVSTEGDRVIVRWDADYPFKGGGSGPGRPVHNEITATIDVRDGYIARHVDEFDFWRWSRQALGLPGVVLGWSGYLRAKVQATAGEQLDRWVAKNVSR
jgi:ketosteroid isomerase-like protein